MLLSYYKLNEIYRMFLLEDNAREIKENFLNDFCVSLKQLVYPLQELEMR